MADVKWIKITTDIFDDEKILLIESLPEADSIIVIWFKLLCLAGKQNNSGVFVMGNSMPYTNKMLATIFRRKEATVQLALQTFQEFGMVEIIDGVITIPNWNKHQTLDSYEKKKERDRLYQAERRAKQKLLVKKSSDTSSDVVISDKDIEKERDIEKEINNILSDSDESDSQRYSSEFLIFWNKYPKKVGKGAAYKTWNKAKPTKAEQADIINALEWQIKSDQWQRENGQYIPHPTTYLSQRRWEDEPNELTADLTDPNRYTTDFDPAVFDFFEKQSV